MTRCTVAIDLAARRQSSPLFCCEPAVDELPRHVAFCFYCCDEVTLCLCGIGPLTGPLSIPQMIRVNMEQRWNDTDRGKPKDSEKSLFQCHFVHHKSHVDCPGREPGPLRATLPQHNTRTHRLTDPHAVDWESQGNQARFEPEYHIDGSVYCFV
jgi:hypothetical protein